MMMYQGSYLFMPLPVVAQVARGEVFGHKIEAGVRGVARVALGIRLQPASEALDDVGMLQVQRQAHLPPDVQHLLWRQVVGRLHHSNFQLLWTCFSENIGTCATHKVFLMVPFAPQGCS